MLVLRVAQPLQAPQVVVEYVSAPHELEDMLVNQSVQQEDDTTRPGVSAALAAVEAAKTVHSRHYLWSSSS